MISADHAAVRRSKNHRGGGPSRDDGYKGSLRDAMIEILRTNDLIMISLIEAIFSEHRVGYFVADQHMSATEGSLGFLQRRVMVASDQAGRARRLLDEAGLGDELRRG